MCRAINGLIKDFSGFRLTALLLFCVVVPVAWSGERLGPPGGPKYLTCPVVGVVYCNDDLGYDKYNPNTQNGCAGKYCTLGPLQISPNPINGCVGEDIQGINVRLRGKFGVGHAVVPNQASGLIDWGDGTTEDIWSGDTLNKFVHHTFLAAKTYYPSAVYGAQFAYTGQGSCGYTCRVQAQAVANIYLATSPECVGGRYHAVQPKKAAAKDKAHTPARPSVSQSHINVATGAGALVHKVSVRVNPLLAQATIDIAP